MALDWMPVRLDLADDPAVIAISVATGLDENAVVGRLVKVWSWANRHTEDGRLRGVTAAWINQFVGKRGFAEAMAATDPPWLVIEADGLTIPKFERYNGSSAKSRAQNTRRQQKSRGQRVSDRTESATESRDCRAESVTEARPKNRTIKNSTENSTSSSEEVDTTWAANEVEEELLRDLLKRCFDKISCCPRTLLKAMRQAVTVNGLTVEQVRSRCQWFANNGARWNAEHRAGAFYTGIAEALPEMPADKGWPYQR